MPRVLYNFISKAELLCAWKLTNKEVFWSGWVCDMRPAERTWAEIPGDGAGAGKVFGRVGKVEDA